MTLRQPKVWPSLTDDDLADLLHFACLTHAVGADSSGAHVNRLYEHSVETLTPEARLRVVFGMGDFLDRYGRAHGSGLATAFLPFIARDPDLGVVSTAALQAAQLMETEGDDAVRGPRELLAVACGIEDESRQAAILAGLTAFGDARVFGLIEAEWERFSEAVQEHVIQWVAGQPPTVAAVEFIVGRLEQWIEDGDDGPIGFVVRALVRLAHIASDASAGPYFAGAGVTDVERLFPSWAVPGDGNPIKVRATYTVSEVGGRIGPRLSRLAADESYPRLLPLAMRAWGIEDSTFVEALRTALEASALNGRHSALLDGAVSIEPLPDWDRHDCVLEWGILSEFGSTKVQLCLVPVADDVSGLVYVAHNQHAPVCLLLGAIWSGDMAASLPRILTSVPERFELGGRMLLSALPHWVRIPEGPAVDVASFGATFFRTLNASECARGVAREPDITEEIDALERLRREPVQEGRRQTRRIETALGEAVAAADAERAVAAALSHKAGRSPTDDGWERWFRAASAPDHVTAVAQHFLACWNAAARMPAAGHGAAADA